MIRLVVLTGLIFVALATKPQQSVFKVTTFKDVPKEMEGSGENFFLNKQDEKAERFIFYTNYVDGLICVNGKMVTMTVPINP